MRHFPRLFASGLCFAGLLPMMMPWAARAEMAPMVATNQVGILAYPRPPAGFQAETASSADLKRYGFPQRPDALRNPLAFEAWQRLVNTRNTRIMPVLKRSAIRHGIMRTVIRNANYSYSTNWSGVADINGNTGFAGTSFYTLFGEWVVPLAQQAFGVCSGGTDYSSTWIGIDGVSSADVMQAGTETDATCRNGTITPNYYVWFEWYPGDAYEITNLPLWAGYDVVMQVVADSTTTASLYLTNETTNESISLQFTAPAGTQLQGNSAEWIIERPEVNNALPTLTNYVADFVSNMVALENNGTAIFGSNSGAGYSVNYITMLDGNSQPISSIYAAEGATTAFHSEGSAK